MDEERQDARPDGDGRTSVLADRNLRASVATAIVGAVTVAWLTAYNLQGCPVWALGSACTTGRSWEEYLLVNLTGLVLVPMVTVFDNSRWPPRTPSDGETPEGSRSSQVAASP